MGDKYIYSNCPIQEAIVEFRLPVSAWDAASPGLIYEKVKEAFPVRKELPPISVTIISGKGATAPAPQVLAPVIRFQSTDESSLLQVGPGLASANALKYKSWIDFREHVRLLASSLQDVANDKTVLRIGTRYVNRFNFEEDDLVINEYLTAGFLVPKTLGSIEGFELTTMSPIEYQINSKSLKGKTRCSLFSEEPRNPFKNCIILDIDCSIEGTLSCSVTKLIECADYLHDLVENIFESFLTPKMRVRLGGIKK